MRIVYRFRASPEIYSTIFDSDHASVFDLKKRVMIERNFEKGTDFHLYAYDDLENPQDELDDKVHLYDCQYIRLRRVPATAPGKGTAHHYVT